MSDSRWWHRLGVNIPDGILSRREWRRRLALNATEVGKSNLLLASLVTQLFAIVSAAMIVCTFIIHDLHLTPVWLTLFVASIFFSAASSSAARRGDVRSGNLVVALFCLLLYVGCIYIAYFAVPRANVISIIVLLVILPLMFIEPPGMMAAIQVVAVAVLLVCNHAWPHPSMPEMELDINLVLVCLGAFLLGSYTGWSRLMALEYGRRLKVAARTDTGLDILNRRSLFEDCSSRDQLENVAGIVMVDVNDFKHVNDTWGHQAGDRCLHEVSEGLVRAGAPYGVTFYRYGGDEFVGVVPVGSEEFGEQAGRLVGEELSNHPIRVRGGQEVLTTVSVGYAPLPDHADASMFERCVNEADQAMYQVKRTRE